MTQSSNISSLYDAIANARDGYIVVVTGAGISLASGIPTFRGSDPDAVWKKDVTELGTLRFFQEDPVASWQWYCRRFDLVLDKEPNAAHDALVSLERWHRARGGEFLLVTQNIDGLHGQAGSDNLVNVHGNAHEVRCTNHGCINGAPAGCVQRSELDMSGFLAAPGPDSLPRCHECGEIFRQHVLWFDEYYDEHESYQWPRVQRAATQMNMVLFVGTSFAVGVTDLFVQQAKRRAIPAYAIDPGARDAPHGIALIREKSELYLPELVSKLARS